VGGIHATNNPIKPKNKAVYNLSSIDEVRQIDVDAQERKIKRESGRNTCNK
jgi:hypothetical protein